eukprot:115357-Rhodomonas_salina.1
MLEVPVCLPSYACATDCPVLTKAGKVSSYATATEGPRPMPSIATRCPVLTPVAAYAMPSTDAGMLLPGGAGWRSARDASGTSAT